MEKRLEDYKKALYMIDMNNGFVNFGPMANPEYRKLIPEQLKIIDKFRKEGELVNFVLEGHTPDATEFKKYPPHCIIGTPEAELIPELISEQNKDNTKIYYKNSINGMLTGNIKEDIQRLTNLKEIVLAGVCTDLCVMDFGRTLSRYLDEINREVVMFLVRNACDTYDAPDHNREEWLNIAYRVLEQAGVIIVEDAKELAEQESRLVLK